MTRRVVTGLDAEGKSCVLLDAPLRSSAGALGSGMVWRTDTLPADNAPQEDLADRPFSLDQMHNPGSLFMVTAFEPGRQAFWHATDTIDYIVMLEGEVVLELESGPVRLRAGDVAVDRGVIHNWHNDTDKPARAAVVVLPAHPVGNGRTI